MSPYVQMLVCLLVHSSVLAAVTGQFVANIITPPKSVNISLNGVAEFNCTGIAQTITWEVNGMKILNNGETIVIPSTIMVNQTQAIRMSKLQLTASSFIADSTSATNITCIVLSSTPLSSDKSEPALLLVQGLLESVSELIVTRTNSTTVLVSWNPPFSLEGVPILGYNITFYSNGEYEIALIEEDITMFYYSFGHALLENDLIVTVIPINEGGAGKSEITTLSFTSSVIKASSDNFLSTSYSPAIPKIYSSAILLGTVYYTTISSTEVQFTKSSYSSDNAVTPSSPNNITVPNASDNVIIEVSVLLLALIGVTIFAVVVILLCITVAITCCFRHKSRAITIKTEQTPLPRDALPVSNNPAYKLVTVHKVHHNTSPSITNTEFPDYEEIEELYFKHTTKEDNNCSNQCNSFYEPVECRL